MANAAKGEDGYGCGRWFGDGYGTTFNMCMRGAGHGMGRIGNGSSEGDGFGSGSGAGEGIGLDGDDYGFILDLEILEEEDKYA